MDQEVCRNKHTHAVKQAVVSLDMSAVIVVSPISQVPSSSSQQPPITKVRAGTCVSADSRSESAPSYGDDLTLWSALPNPVRTWER